MPDNCRVRYGILGTTQAVRDDGTQVQVGGPRMRALLAALALRAGKAVPARVLIDELWAEDPPADPQDALQTLVARLRRALGPEQVGSADEGYRLVHADTDLLRFEALAAPGSDADALRSALALWRGDALADLPSRPDAAARCEAQRVTVQRRLLAAEIELGRAASVLQELAGLVERRPLDEHLQTLQLRALRDSGRVPEGLLAYEEFRRRLADELGTDPGPELRALHAELLAGPTPALPASASASGPAPKATIAAPTAPAGNLRPRLTSFVGREAELAALRDLLPGRRLLTLTGPGGSGKTRLAQQAAEALPAAVYPDGVWMAELAPLDDPQAVPGAVLSALGLRGTLLHVGGKSEVLTGSAEPESPMDRLFDHCTGRRLLLVLDNCEHLIQAAAELAEQLTAACPGVTVLATSREPLAVPGEELYPVEPLPDPNALQLLAERGSVDPAVDPVSCAEICRRLDGLPLAIELAAARLRALTPRQLADRLDDRFQLLTGGNRTDLPRQQTLRAVVDWSWDLLDKPERTLLARLSVFAGGWTMDAAEQVCADDLLPRGEIAPLLVSLVDKSLVQADLDGPAARYRMLETIHEYAAERLQETADRDALTDRHIRHYRELARTTDPLLRGRGQLPALTLLETEHDNIRAAMRRAVVTGAEQEALCLVLAMCWFWQLRNYETEAAGWFQAVAPLSPPDAPADPPPVPLTEGPTDLPPPWSPEVLADARRGAVLCRFITNSQHDFSAPLPTPERTAAAKAFLGLYDTRLPQSSRLPALYRIYAQLFVGELNTMAKCLDEMVEGCRAQGREWELAYSLQIRCKMANDQPGGLAGARRDAEESLEIFTRLGDTWGMGEALSGQAENAGFIGDFELAASVCRQAIAMARSIGSEQEIGMLQVRLGEALLGLGAEEEGEASILEGIASADGQGPRGQGPAFYGTFMLAALRGRQQRFVECRALLESIRSGMDAFGMGSMLTGMVDGMLGWVDAKEGRPEEGLALLRSGFERMDEHPLAPLVSGPRTLAMFPAAAFMLLECARRAGTREPAERGAALLGAYEALRPSGSVHQLEREVLAEAVAGLRELLGEQAFDAAHERGSGLDADSLHLLLHGAD